MARIRIDGHEYRLPEEPEAQVVAAAVRTAVEAKGMLELQVEAEGSPITLFVNTAEVGVIALDWDGTGAGFTHG